MKQIIKSSEGEKPDCILDAIALIDLMGIEDHILAVVCSSEDINDLSMAVRIWRIDYSIDKNRPLVYLTTSYEREPGV